MDNGKEALTVTRCLLTRAALADALTAAGFPIAAATLAGLAWRRRGPPYQRWGRTTLYPWADALAWARDRARPPHGRSGAGSHRTAAARNQRETRI